MTEAQLISRAGAGDGHALRELYERHASRVFSVIRRIVGDDEPARDVAQEAWLRAIRALPSFREEARFSTWLHRIAVNTALEAARRAEAREGRDLPVPPEIPVADSSGDVLLARMIEIALTHLPGGMRQILVLHDIEHYTHEEISELLGITAGTSKSQLSKARGRMRELLGSRLTEGEGERKDIEAKRVDPTERTSGAIADRTYEGAKT